MDEPPKTFVFLPNTDSVIANETIRALIEGKQPEKIYYLPQSAYFQSAVGQVAFIIEDHDQLVNLNGLDPTGANELGFAKPTCDLVSEVPFRLLCRSTVFVANARPDDNSNNEHLIVTPLQLTRNEKTNVFPKPLRLKFENIVSVRMFRDMEKPVVSKYI